MHQYWLSRAEARDSSEPLLEIRARRLQHYRALPLEKRPAHVRRDFRHQLADHPGAVIEAYGVAALRNSLAGTPAYHPSKKDRSDIPLKALVRDGLYRISQFQNALYSLGLLFFFIWGMKKSATGAPPGWTAFRLIAGLALWLWLTTNLSYWAGDRLHLLFYPLVLSAAVMFGCFKGRLKSH